MNLNTSSLDEKSNVKDFFKITYTPNGTEILINKKDVSFVYSEFEVLSVKGEGLDRESNTKTRQTILAYSSLIPELMEIINWPSIMGFTFPIWYRPKPFYIRLKLLKQVLIGVASIQESEFDEKLPVLSIEKVSKFLTEGSNYV